MEEKTIVKSKRNFLRKVKEVQKSGTYLLENLEIKAFIMDNENIENIIFKNCKFKNCRFERVLFYTCTFENCFIEGCFNGTCKFENCIFDDSSINNTIFNNSNFSYTEFLNCKIISSEFVHCIIYDSRFTNKSIFNLCSFSLSSILSSKIEIDFKNNTFYGATISRCRGCGEIYQFGNIGQRNSITNYVADKDLVICGCWNDYKGGSLKDFKYRIENEYGKNGNNPNYQYYNEYTAIIKSMEELKKLHEGTKNNE